MCVCACVRMCIIRAYVFCVFLCHTLFLKKKNRPPMKNYSQAVASAITPVAVLTTRVTNTSTQGLATPLVKKVCSFNTRYVYNSYYHTLYICRYTFVPGNCTSVIFLVFYEIEIYISVTYSYLIYLQRPF